MERIAEARGEARGKSSVVLSLLGEVCGSVPKEYEDRVRKIELRTTGATGESSAAIPVARGSAKLAQPTRRIGGMRPRGSRCSGLRQAVWLLFRHHRFQEVAGTQRHVA